MEGMTNENREEMKTQKEPRKRSTKRSFDLDPVFLP